MEPKRLVHDEFLVAYFRERILPLVCTSTAKKVMIAESLDEFNAYKYNFQKEIEATYKVYLNLESLHRSMRTLGASEEKIGKLLSVLRKLQQFLFHIPYYRDHLPHQLRVYLLGCYIMESNMGFFTRQLPSKYAEMISALLGKNDEDHRLNILDSLRRGLECNPQVIYDAWSIAGLCHDLGYCVQGIKNVAANLCDAYKELVPELNMQMSPQILPDPSMQSQISAFGNALKNLYPKSGEELAKLVSALSQDMNHGIWSCFFLASEDLANKIEQNTITLKNRMSNLTLWDLVSDFNLVSGDRFAADLLPVLYAEALIAIAFHDKPSLRYLSPLAFLLVVSDTLQEWNRVGNLSTEIDQQRRDVYLTMENNGKGLSIKSEIYTYDCSPASLYQKIVYNFQPGSELSRVNLSMISSEFIQGSSFIISVGPSPTPLILTA